MIEIRDYQKDCLKSVFEAFRDEGVSKPLVVLPTGTGKTVIFAYIIKATQGRSLVLVHRDELLAQAEDKLLTVHEGADIGIVKAERNELDHQVTITSVQTLSREKRLRQLANMDIMDYPSTFHTILGIKIVSFLGHKMTI